MPQRMPQRTAANMGNKDKNRCCTWPVLILAVVLAGVAGILIWQFAPIGNAVDDILPRFNSTDGEGGSPPTSSPAAAPSYQFFQCTDLNNCCNGLDDACNLRVNEVLFAMAHNAMSTAENGYPILLFPNHEFSLERALEAGYRGLSIDVCNCDGELQLCHGFCDVGAREPAEVFANVVSFLEQNPTETVMFNIEINNDFDGDVQLSSLYSIMEGVNGFIDMTYVHDPNTNPDWPTLGTLVDNNERIVMFHLNGPTSCNNNACPPGLHYWFDFASETPFSFSTEGDLLDTDRSCRIDRGGRSTEFFAINNFITPPVKNIAKQINTKDFIEKRIAACSDLNGGANPNVVYVDYWSYGDLLEVTQNHNKALAQRKRRKMLR